MFFHILKFTSNHFQEEFSLRNRDIWLAILTIIFLQIKILDNTRFSRVNISLCLYLTLMKFVFSHLKVYIQSFSRKVFVQKSRHLIGDFNNYFYARFFISALLLQNNRKNLLLIWYSFTIWFSLSFLRIIVLKS